MGTRLSKAYMLTKVLTASNLEVVVYLYEGAIGYLHRAGEALRDGRRADAFAAIDRATTIVIELSGNLDYKSGGALALRLDSIYNHLIQSLTHAAAAADPEAVEACESVLVILHDAWQQAAVSSDPATVRPDRQLRISA